jgi:hypothetical protein
LTAQGEWFTVTTRLFDIFNLPGLDRAFKFKGGGMSIIEILIHDRYFAQSFVLGRDYPAIMATLNIRKKPGWLQQGVMGTCR